MKGRDCKALGSLQHHDWHAKALGEALNTREQIDRSAQRSPGAAQGLGSRGVIKEPVADSGEEGNGETAQINAETELIDT